MEGLGALVGGSGALVGGPGAVVGGPGAVVRDISQRVSGISLWQSHVYVALVRGPVAIAIGVITMRVRLRTPYGVPPASSGP